MFSWAFELLFNNDNFGEKELKRVTNIFLKMIEEVFIGQFIDVKMSSDENPNEKSIFQKMYLKTAGYSFTHPMMIGASLVKEIKNEEFFKQFGLVLGISFQIQDDLFDIIYDSNEIFKSSFNDISLQITFLKKGQKSKGKFFGHILVKKWMKKEKKY